MEVRVVPMRNGGHDLALEIGQDGFHRFALFGRGGGQRGGEIARLDTRDYGVVARVFQIARDPVDHLMAVAAEFVG